MQRLISAQTRIADATAVGVNVLATWTWVAEVETALRLVLTIAGIVAAVAATRYHLVKTKALKDKNED